VLALRVNHWPATRVPIAETRRSSSSIFGVTSVMWVKAAQTSPDAKVVYRTADAGNPDSLTAALDWCAHVPANACEPQSKRPRDARAYADDGDGAIRANAHDV
jgi:hypothetical protein